MDVVIVIVTGAAAGVVIAILLAISAFLCIKLSQSTSRRTRRLASNASITSTTPLPTTTRNDSFDTAPSINSPLPTTTLRATSVNSEGNSNCFWWSKPNNRQFGIQRYPHKEIQTATDNFTTCLGEGSFGSVYKADMPSGEVVAVKVLALKSSQGEREFQTEVRLLSRHHHPNLVNLVGYSVDKGRRMLIYEYMSNGSVSSHLYSDGPKTLSWEERMQIIFDVSQGINYLHEEAVVPVLHRDLKPSNILLNEYMRAKVSDFGLSKEAVNNGRMSGLKGTYGYIDPNYLTTGQFTTKSDIYSFGLLVFELITAINPHKGLTDYINLATAGGGMNDADWDTILDHKLIGNCDLSQVKLLADIAYRCLDDNPQNRPSIVDVIAATSAINGRGHFNIAQENQATNQQIPNA